MNDEDRPVKVHRAGWTSASFLTYAGALTVLFSLFALLGVIAADHGQGAFAGWTVVIFLVIEAIAVALRQKGRHVAAGTFGFVAVIMFGGVVAAFFNWFGWLHSGDAPFSGFHLVLIIVGLTLAAGFVALRVFKFPLIVLIQAVLGWYFITDLVSNGGNWTAVVTLIVGLTFLVKGLMLDGGASRPYGFWVHVVAAFTIGGSLLYFWHSSDFEWTLIIIVSLVLISIGSAARRSIYAVVGAIGLTLATGHFALDQTLNIGGQSFGRPQTWVGPISYLCLGFFFAFLGLLLSRRGETAEAT